MTIRRITQCLAVAALIAGIAAVAGSDSSLRVPRETPWPTREEARRALVALVESMPEGERGTYGLSDLRNGQGLVLIDGRTDRGLWTHRWNCDPTDGTFAFQGSFRPHGCTRTDHGVFERTAQGWRARIVGQNWACSK